MMWLKYLAPYLLIFACKSLKATKKVAEPFECYVCRSSDVKNCEITQTKQQCKQGKNVCLAYIHGYITASNVRINIYTKECGKQSINAHEVCRRKRESIYDFCTIKAWCTESSCNKNSTIYERRNQANKATYSRSSLTESAYILCLMSVVFSLVVYEVT